MFSSIRMGRNCTNFPQGLYCSFDSFARILKLVVVVGVEVKLGRKLRHHLCIYAYVIITVCICELINAVSARLAYKYTSAPYIKVRLIDRKIQYPKSQLDILGTDAICVLLFTSLIP